jgi:hypothetical protein
MNAILTSLVLTLISFQAVADEISNNHNPIGNYNFIEIGLANTTEANSICAGSECYKTLRGTELTASLNFESIPQLLISATSSSEGASGTNSNLTYSIGKLLIGLIGGFGSVDAAVTVGSLSASILTCPNGSNVCQDVIENGTDYGAIAKLWLGDGKDFNLGINLDRYSYAPSSANISSSLFGTWLPARHHSLSITYKSTMDINQTPISSGGTVAYAYLF